MSATQRTTCRACDGTDLTSVLDLAWQPLANGFLTDATVDEPEAKYPLHLVRCLTCGLCQLSVVVDPHLLYDHYLYASGHAQGWHTHCKALAAEIAVSGGRLLDIASNDGVMLHYASRQGMDVLGCDPAKNLSLHSSAPILREMFTREVGESLRGQFDVITAQNVFGHVDDARGFLEGVAAALKPNGVAIIECPWIADLICTGAWDTIYHEHLSYWGQWPLRLAADGAGLNVSRMQRFPALHGGTMRYYLDHASAPAPLGDILDDYYPDGLDMEDCQRFAIRAMSDIRRWDDYFQHLNGQAVAGYGAAAKMNVFLNALPNRPPLVGIFDDNPQKWNLYTPGWHYPVLKPTKMTLRETDVLIVGASNWKAEIEARARELGFAGEVKSLWG